VDGADECVFEGDDVQQEGRGAGGDLEAADAEYAASFLGYLPDVYDGALYMEHRGGHRF